MDALIVATLRHHAASCRLEAEVVEQRRTSHPQLHERLRLAGKRDRLVRQADEWEALAEHASRQET